MAETILFIKKEGSLRRKAALVGIMTLFLFGCSSNSEGAAQSGTQDEATTVSPEAPSLQEASARFDSGAGVFVSTGAVSGKDIIVRGLALDSEGSYACEIPGEVDQLGVELVGYKPGGEAVALSLSDEEKPLFASRDTASNPTPATRSCITRDLGEPKNDDQLGATWTNPDDEQLLVATVVGSGPDTNLIGLLADQG